GGEQPGNWEQKCHRQRLRYAVTGPCASKGKSNSSTWRASRTVLAVAPQSHFAVAATLEVSPFAMDLTGPQVFKTSSKLGTFRPSHLRLKANACNIINS